MKKSFKKLSMMVMLGFILNSTSTEAKHKHHNDEPTSSEITVVNLPKDQFIATEVVSGNSVQTPVNGKYTFHFYHTYYAIKRNPGSGSTPKYDTVMPNTKQYGTSFKGKKTWDIATNKIS